MDEYRKSKGRSIGWRYHDRPSHAWGWRVQIRAVAKRPNPLLHHFLCHRFADNVVECIGKLDCPFVGRHGNDRGVLVRILDGFDHSCHGFAINYKGVRVSMLVGNPKFILLTDWHSNIHKDEVELHIAGGISDRLGPIPSNDTPAVQSLQDRLQDFAADRIIFGQ